MIRKARLRRKKALIILLSLLLVAFSWNTAVLYYRAILLLVRSSSSEVLPWWLASAGFKVKEKSGELLLPGHKVRIHYYSPIGVESPPGILLVHGIHYLGIDEPRLHRFARAFASTGILVLTPEMPDLANYRITISTISDISALAQYTAKTVNQTHIGVIGISIAGGLALIAANRAQSKNGIGYVLAIGAHHDLLRVVDYYSGETIRGPEGTPYTVHPHPYGARVILSAYLEEVFSSNDIPIAREAIRLYLHDQHRRAKSMVTKMSGTGASQLLQILDHTNNEMVANWLKTIRVTHQSQLMRVSPHGKLDHIRIPIFLIHGEDDPVIPSTETKWLASEIPHSYLQQVLISPLLRHAEVARKPSIISYFQLVRFFANLLEQSYHLQMSNRNAKESAK